ncbi:MAG: hypothetical protein SGJ19_18250 [Planctomycetia bacterium]|nr:hypothetical protein [Planctomycetia bacterium]
MARDIDFHTRSLEGTGERAVAGRTTGLIGPGESVTWEARHLGIRQRLTVEVSTFDRPCYFRDVMMAGAFQSFAHDHRFSHPAQIRFDGPRDFTFSTPCPSKVEENNIVYGRLYQSAERRPERPVIVLLDGGFAIGYHSAFPLLARRFNRAGFDVAALVAPYNLQRRPRRPMEENCLEFAREIAQNVAEIRALIGWLLDEGCPAVGLLGFSFGGMACGFDCVQRYTHRWCRADCAPCAHEMLPTGRLAEA